MATKTTENDQPEQENLGTVVDLTAEGATPAENTPEPPKMADLQGVRYVGGADKKTLTADDLIGVGIENPKGDLVFSRENGFFVSGSEINAATRDWLATQPDFVIE